MISLISPSKAQRILQENIRERRLQLNYTQEGLAERSGVPLATLRKFEQQGTISLESFLKLLLVLGMLEDMVKSTEVQQAPFTSIDEVLAPDTKTKRKRGRRK